MLLRRVLAVLLAAAQPAYCAGSLAPALTAATLAPSLTMPQITLLSRHKYEVHSDGTVWEPGGKEALAAADVAALLPQLESRQRLTALLRLKLILTSSDGEKYLTPSEREQVRSLLRDNWPYFTLRMRKGFRSYFSLEELETMNRVPPAEEETVAQLKDPELDAPAEASPFVPPISAAAPPAVAMTAPPAAPAQAPSPASAPTASLPGLGAVAAPKGELVAKAPVPAPSADIVALRQRTVIEPSNRIDPVAVPAATPTQAAATTAATAPVAAAPIPAPTATTAAAAPSPASAPEAPAPPPMPSLAGLALPPPPRPVPAAEFEKFLADAPYAHEVRGLLKLVSDQAPAFARDRALEVVMNTMPLIIVDSARTGFQARADLMIQQSSNGETAYEIALSPGPVLYARKRLFGKTTALLPDSPRSYSPLHLPAPDVEALKRDAVALKIERTDWGESREFSDRSLRGAFSDPEIAGSLLRALLRLDAHRRGWDVSPYAAELYARTAQMMLYHKIAAQTGKDDFLGPDLRAAYRQWLGHPAEFRDLLVHSLSAGRVQLLDPRKGGPQEQARFDRDALAACPQSLADDAAARAAVNRDALLSAADSFHELGLVDDKALAEAKAAIEADVAAAAKRVGQPGMDACVRRWQGEAAGLRLAQSLLGEMEAATAALRKEQTPSGERNAR